MTVKAIRLENFMAFEDSGWIELRPINLLFGRNSSGKSVMIRALRLLKQSLYSKNKTLVLSAEGQLNLGLFRQIVHQQQANKSITFHFRSELNGSLSEQLLSAIDETRGNKTEIHATNNQEEIKVKTACPLGIDFALSFDQSNKHQIQLAAVGLACHSDESPNQLFTAEKIEGEWRLQRGELLPEIADEDAHWLNTSLSCPYGFLPELKFIEDAPPPASHELQLIQKLLTTLREKITDFLEKIEYLNPLRPEPERIYFINENFSTRLEVRGLSAWLTFLRNEVDSDKKYEIDHWLKQLGLGHKVTIKTREIDDEIVRTSMVNMNENQTAHPDINLSHLGFGASQVLPVIVQSVLAKEGSLVIIEQPELHLHPRAQAQLADLFVNMARKGVHFLLETHSEHLLLRLLRRIAESSAGMHDESEKRNQFLQEDDLGIYFVHRDNKGVSSTEEIKVTANGELMNIPKGFDRFFADSLHETIARARAARNIK